MKFIKNLFRKKWNTCTRCKRTIYYGDHYGTITMRASELSLTGEPITFVYCESCSTGGDQVDGKWQSITKRGIVT